MAGHEGTGGFSMSWMLILTLFAAILPVSQATLPDDNYLIYSHRRNQYVNGGLFLYRGTIPEIIQDKYSKYTITFDVSNVDITGMDTDVKTKTLFFFESVTRCLYSVPFLNQQTLTLTVEHCGISTSSYVTIAYDWVSRNIYWTDPYFGWIVVQPVGVSDNTMFKIIVQKDNYRPGALTLDPVNGYLFWYDQFVNGERIERSLLTGESRTTIVTTESNCIGDMVADVTSQRLYWVDFCRHAIETAKYDGSDRKVFYREDGVSFYDIAIEENNICTTIPNWGTFVCHDKTSGVKKVERSSWTREPRAITLYDRNKQKQRTDWCASKGCEHFCVNKKDVAQCMCKEGFVLKSDEKSCEGVHSLGKGILASTATQICQLDFRVLTGQGKDMTCFLRNVNVEHMAVNIEGHKIYFADKNTNTIKAYDTITNTSTVAYSSIGTSGMAFNWVDKDLYWTESRTIRVLSILTSNSRALYTSSNMLYFINVDPHNKTLFWVEKTSSSYFIKSSSLDATGSKTLYTVSTSVSGLFFDVRSNRLYYMDKYGVYSLTRDGGGRKREYSTNILSTFAIYKSYAVWPHTDVALESVLLARQIKYKIDITELGKVKGLSVFDPALQPKEKGHCDELNGGCEHICIGTGDTRECRCRFGYKLNPDGISCDTTVIQNNFMLATDKDHGKIYQISLTDGTVTSLDLPSIDRPQAAVYDTKRRLVFWTQGTGELMKANLDGSFPTLVYKSGYGTVPYKMVVDDTSGYIYFTVSDNRYMYKGKVMVQDPVSNYRKTIVTGLERVEGLALYPSKGYMFYVNHDLIRYRIYRASMDGKNKLQIKSSSYQRIHSLTIDYTSDTIYWIQYDKIKYSDLSGSGTGTLPTSVGSVTAIVASNGFLYYTGDNAQQITKFDIKNKKNIQFMKDTAEMGIINSLDVEDGYSPPVNDKCTGSSHGCNTFCLPTVGGGYTCACRDGTTILADGKTCPDAFTTKYSSSSTHPPPPPSTRPPPPSTRPPPTSPPPTRPPPPPPTTTRNPTTTPSTTTTTPKPTTTTTTTTPKPTTTTTTTTKPTTTTTTTTKPTTTTTTTTPKPTTTTTTTTTKPTTTTTTTTPKPTTTTTTTTKPTTTTTTTTTKATTTTTTTTTKPTTTTTTTTTKPTTTTTTTTKPTTTTTTTRKPTTTTTTTSSGTTTSGAAIVCSDQVVNGEIDANCLRESGHVCTFTCNDRYKSDKGYNIICTVTGQWSEDVTNICRSTTAVVLPKRSDSQTGSEGTYIGVGAGVGILFIVGLIIIGAIYYKRRMQSDKPRVIMNNTEEGFVNPSYTAEGVDGSTAGYTTMENTRNHAKDPKDNHDYDTVSTTGGKREMRHSEYMAQPDDHIYESIKAHKNSPTRSGSHSSRRPGGVEALNELYHPDSDYATRIPQGYYYQPTISAGNPVYGGPYDYRVPSGDYAYMPEDDFYSSASEVPSRRGSKSKLVKDKRK